MPKMRLFIVPHTHYDAEVFLTRDVTLRIGADNILDVLYLLDRDPDYRYVLDQRCYLEGFAQLHPEQVASLKAHVASGRLELAGGMHVMPDANLPSGESLVRQILYGRAYLDGALGAHSSLGWMLDSFGHHPQMPQIMREGGFDSYWFQRGIADEKQASAFWWQGLDGTTIRAEWMPHTYVLLASVPGSLPAFREVIDHIVESVQPYQYNNQYLVMSGHDLSAPVGHLPDLIRRYNASQAEVELVLATPGQYLQAQSTDGFETRQGDLNPVFTGCYAARIALKQRNRELENKLFTAEKLLAVNWATFQQPAESLEPAWEPVLFNQFHDLICGSHLDPAYERATARYGRAGKLAEGALTGALDRLVEQVDTRGDGLPLVVFNPLATERKDVARCVIGLGAEGWETLSLYDENDQQIPLQLEDVRRHPDGSIKRAELIFIARVPALGYRTYFVRPGDGRAPQTDLWVQPTSWGREPGMMLGNLHPDDGRMGNSLVTVGANLRTGALSSLVLRDLDWDVVDRQQPHGFGSVCRQEDRGDPWEYYGPLRGGITTAYPLVDPVPPRGQAQFSDEFGGIGWAGGGPVMAQMRVDSPFNDGKFSVRLRLYAGLPRVELTTGLINRRQFVRYRQVFPLNLPKPRITYEIPFGALDRPEGEYPAQNWVDVGDGERGVALLNRGVPGHSLVGSTLTASLLKCVQVVSYAGGGYSEDTRDQAGFEIGVQHQFEHALLPHRGAWQEAKVYQEALAFNAPLIVQATTAHAGRLPAGGSFMTVRPDNMLVHAFYVDGDELVLRMAEAAGEAAEGRVTLRWQLAGARETDFLGNTRNVPAVAGGSFTFAARPFEIKTFRLRLA